MKPTKSEAEAFLKWLRNPDDPNQALRVMDDISEAIIAVLRKHNIV